MGKEIMEKILNFPMEISTWYEFWDEFEGKFNLNTPKFSRELLNWVHRFIIDKPFTHRIAPKLYNNKKNDINDRLAIGIKPNPSSRIAFAIFPMKSNRDPLRKGDLLFIFYAVNAQNKDERQSEEHLVKWLVENEVSENMAKFLFPVGYGIQYDGKLDYTGPYYHYAQSAIRGFGDGKITLLNKESKQSEAINLADMESLLTAMIHFKIK